MARKRDRQAGRTIRQLQDLSPKEVRSMARNELASVVTRLASAANKRLRRFERRGLETPATRKVARSGGRFSVRGKGLEGLRKEYQRVKDFLSAESSTQAGYRRQLKRVARGLREAGVDVPRRMSVKGLADELGGMFDAYERLREFAPGVADAATKYKAFQKLVQWREGGDSWEEIKQNVTRLYDEEYERAQEQAREDERSIESFFKVD